MMELKVGDWIKIISANHPMKEKHLNRVYKIIKIHKGYRYSYDLSNEHTFLWAEHELEKMPKKEALAYAVAE